MQSGKSYAAAAGASTRKPQATSAKPSGGGSNGAPTSNKKKAGESKAKSNGKDAAAAPPGFAAPKQAAVAAPAPTRGFSAQQQRVLRHRALFAFRFFVGKAVEVQLDDASVYAGVLDCVDPDDFSIVLKNTHRKSEYGEAFQSGSSVVFKRHQIAHIVADGVVNYTESALGTAGAVAAAAGGFRTDTEISGRQLDHLVGRELQAASSWLDPQLDSGELEDPRRRSSKSGWNQFEANEKLFGVVSSFDENIYTTKLDKSKISTQQSRDAERIALEIERQASSNFHVQEERNHRAAGGDDLDEEARYSSVDRKHHATARGPSSSAATGKNVSVANSYVPPALRNAPRQSSGGKSQTQAKPVAAPAPASTPAVSTPATAATATPVAAAAPKPLSFSDAVTGRTLASAAKPEPKNPAVATPVAAAAANGTGSKAEVKAAATPAAATTTASSETKAPAAAPDATAKAPTAKAAKEAKAKAPAAASTAPPPPVSKSEKTENAEKAAAPVKKTALNPNAKEFKFNVAAAEFTPKFAPPPAVTSSPYRGAQQPPPHHHHQAHHHNHHHHPAQHMGHMHHQPHPAAMGGVVYSPMPDEWMYDGGVVGIEDPELLAPQGYMPYGVPMVPGAVMQPQMYPQMLPQRMIGGGGGGQRPHGGGGGGGAYGYQQPPYNPRGYYPPNAGVPGGMPYPGAVPVVAPAPQPPLPPREPSPSDGAPPPASSSSASASPALPPQQQPPPSNSAKTASAKK